LLAVSAVVPPTLILLRATEVSVVLMISPLSDVAAKLPVVWTDFRLRVVFSVIPILPLPALRTRPPN
jgi:hypothetical protein